MRGHAGEPTHVVVLRTLGAPQRRLLGRVLARLEAALRARTAIGLD